MTIKTALTLSIEAASDRGEDAYLVWDDAETLVIGVFDGLGGRPAGYDGLTGGRIASEITAQLTESFLTAESGKLTEENIAQLQQQICEFLKQEADGKMKRSRLAGTLTGKRLCTTLALASIPHPRSNENFIEINLAWIGDSRIYFLSSEKGLQQLTVDDLEIKNDAFQMIHEDSPMSGHITADMPSGWRIHFKSEQFESSGCVIAATDGCFQYLPSPWDFEKLLLETLDQSNDITEWHNILTQEYEKIKQDDVCLALYPVLIEDDFAALKSAYQPRLAYLKDNFDSKNRSYKDLKRLWNIYQNDYEQRLKPTENEIIDDSFSAIKKLKNLITQSSPSDIERIADIGDKPEPMGDIQQIVHNHPSNAEECK